MSDLALVNGRVWPAAGGGPTAVRTSNGVISAVGSDAEVLDARTGGTEVVDLKGRVVMPGFTDSHTHYHRTAILRRHFIDFDDDSFGSVADVVAAVAARATEKQPGTWIEGDSLSELRLSDRRFPTRQELDAAAPNNPVLLRGVGKHLVVANSRALELAGIDRTTPDPPGGRIERDAAGDPTGVLHERGKLRLDTTRVDTVVPALTMADRLDALSAGIRELHRHGVTAIHEITRTRDEFGDYVRLRERGELGVRVVSYVRVIEAQATLDALTSVGLRSGYGDDWLRLGGVKVSIDGSCTFKNAAVYDAYPGAPENFGIVRIEQDELDEVVRAADAGGLAIAVHAIGPRAVDMALDAFAKVRAAGPGTALPHRIEHAYVSPGRDRLQRMHDLGVVLSTQPAFISSVGDIWADIFGKEETERMVPLRTALDVGLTVLANSDSPLAPADPLLAIATAVGRQTRGGLTLGTGEAVSVEEAVAMQTTAPAAAIRQEHSSGLVAPGMLGDVVVLGDDPRTVPATEISTIPVCATVVGGMVAFQDALS